VTSMFDDNLRSKLRRRGISSLQGAHHAAKKLIHVHRLAPLVRGWRSVPELGGSAPGAATGVNVPFGKRLAGRASSVSQSLRRGAADALAFVLAPCPALASDTIAVGMLSATAMLSLRPGKRPSLVDALERSQAQKTRMRVTAVALGALVGMDSVKVGSRPMKRTRFG